MHSRVEMDGAKSHCRAGHAFTLVELLVVLVIIAILFGMIASALPSGTAKVRLTQCQNNLRQHGVALTQFNGEHHGFPFTMEGTNTLTINDSTGYHSEGIVSWEDALGLYSSGLRWGKAREPNQP